MGWVHLGLGWNEGNKAPIHCSFAYFEFMRVGEEKRGEERRREEKRGELGGVKEEELGEGGGAWSKSLEDFIYKS